MKPIHKFIWAAAFVLLCGCSDNNTYDSGYMAAANAFSEKSDLTYSVQPTTAQAETSTGYQYQESGYKGLLDSSADINLHDINGRGTDYAFVYDGEEYRAVYEPDIWHIMDSYRIDNYYDLAIICQALSDIHPIHSADMTGYRTAEDMATEWQQHNLAYFILPPDSQWKENAKNVDLDPDDQGRSMLELFMDRAGD